MTRAKIVWGGIATLTALLVTAGPASAHFCYKNNLSPQAAAGMANSQGFASFGELAFEFTGLCPAGIEVLADAAASPPPPQSMLARSWRVAPSATAAPTTRRSVTSTSTRSTQPSRTRRPPAPRTSSGGLAPSIWDVSEVSPYAHHFPFGSPARAATDGPGRVWDLSSSASGERCHLVRLKWRFAWASRSPAQARTSSVETGLWREVTPSWLRKRLCEPRWVHDQNPRNDRRLLSINGFPLSRELARST